MSAPPDPWGAEVDQFLQQATLIAHLGGTLAEHLDRVARRLQGLGSARVLVAAGRTHAAYGTDGFASCLLDYRRDRARLAGLVGHEAEALVYRYAGCDRAASWPGLAEHHAVTDRFTGTTTVLRGLELRRFADLCIVNELDVLDHAHLPEHLVDEVQRVVATWRELASPGVGTDADRTLRDH